MQEKATETQRVYRFGLYEADLGQGVLTRQGIPVRLQEQPFRLLALLLEAHGEILSREDLRKGLWPEGTFVEFDGSLNTALMKLRAALNDDAENPVFVETVPRKGYRFIAPVEQIQAEGAGPATAPSGEPEGEAAAEVTARIASPGGQISHETIRASAKSGFWSQNWAGAAIVAGVALIAAYGLWPKQEPRLTAIRQLTHSGQVDPGGKLVTDGSRIYFVVRDVTGWNLMQTSIEGGGMQRTPVPFDNTRIFDLSADHTQFLIGQATHRGEETHLWSWPVQGGAPRRLGDLMAAEAVWSPTAAEIAFVHGENIEISTPMGTDVRTVAKFRPAPHSLVWSPDGKRLRFTRTDLAEGTDSMWEIGVDGAGLRRVLPEVQRLPHEGSGAWLDNGKYFVFSAGINPRLSLAVDSDADLWLLAERQGLFGTRSKSPIQLTQGPIAFDHPTAMPDGSRLVAIGAHSAYQLLRFDPKTRTKTAIMTQSGATDMDFAQDGQWVVYAARETGTLWKSRIDGFGRVQLTAPGTGAFAPNWSPDQKQILFTGFQLDKQPRLYLVSAQGGTPKSVLPQDKKWISISGDWRTDGKQIVLDVQDLEAGAKPDIRVLDLSSGNLTLLPGSTGLIEPRWSVDGRYVAALNPTKKQVLLFDMKTEEWNVLAEGNFPTALRWSPSGDSLYYQDMDEVAQSVYRVPMATRRPEKAAELGDLLSYGATRGFFTGVSPDGSIFVAVDHGDVDVYAVEVELP